MSEGPYRVEDSILESVRIVIGDRTVGRYAVQDLGHATYAARMLNLAHRAARREAIEEAIGVVEYEGCVKHVVDDLNGVRMGEERCPHCRVVAALRTLLEKNDAG